MNEGFLAGANAGVARSRAPHVLLLNNDAEVLPGSIEAALATLMSSPAIGAVGGKLVAMLSGALQEAGSVVFGDGSCSAVREGRQRQRSDAHVPAGRRLLFRSILDARAAPSLMSSVDSTRGSHQPITRMWISAPGFGTAGAGSCMSHGPSVLHAEFGSAPSRAAAIEMQSARRDLFLQKHATWIRRRPGPGEAAELVLRNRRPVWKRVLFLEDCVPHGRLGVRFRTIRRDGAIAGGSRLFCHAVSDGDHRQTNGRPPTTTSRGLSRS